MDLLLRLIEEEKMDITEVAISKVTEQFLDYLEKMAETPPEELADFLLIATKLVYVKSKNLLPYLSVEEEDDGPSLADQLKLYKEYLEASKKVNALWTAGRVAYGREEPPVKMEGFVLPANAGSANLHASFLELVKRFKPLVSFPSVTMDRAISVAQKVQSIRDLIGQYKKINFSQLLQNTANRTEVIISFLAVLELIRSQTVYIRQTCAFEEMVVERV